MITAQVTDNFNALDIIFSRGHRTLSDLPHVSHNGTEYFVGYKGNSAIIAAIMPDTECIVLPKYELLDMVRTAKIEGIKWVFLYTNYGLEIHSKEGCKSVGIDCVHKLCQSWEGV